MFVVWPSGHKLQDVDHILLNVSSGHSKHSVAPPNLVFLNIMLLIKTWALDLNVATSYSKFERIAISREWIPYVIIGGDSNISQSSEFVLLSNKDFPSIPILNYSLSVKPFILYSIVTLPPLTGSSISGKALSSNFWPWGNPTPESNYWSILTCHP